MEKFNRVRTLWNLLVNYSTGVNVLGYSYHGDTPSVQLRFEHLVLSLSGRHRGPGASGREDGRDRNGGREHGDVHAGRRPHRVRHRHRRRRPQQVNRLWLTTSLTCHAEQMSFYPAASSSSSSQFPPRAAGTRHHSTDRFYSGGAAAELFTGSELGHRKRRQPSLHRSLITRIFDFRVRLVVQFPSQGFLLFILIAQFYFENPSIGFISWGLH